MIRFTLALIIGLSAASACVGAAQLEPGDHEFALTVQNLHRSYLVHVPPQAAAGKPLPVVLNFHGGGAHAAEQKRYSRMDQAAARDGYIAVYPSGSSGIGGRLLTWNAGAMTLQGFAPRLLVPVMHIHSVDDRRALYDGGLGLAFPSADTRVLHESVDGMLRKWIAHDGCPAKPQVAAPVSGRPKSADASHTATRHTYGPCRGGTEVVLWKLTGAGHVWPGGLQDYLPLLLGEGTTVIDANSEMWRFFSRFRRPQR